MPRYTKPFAPDDRREPGRIHDLDRQLGLIQKTLLRMGDLFSFGNQSRFDGTIFNKQQ
jgi:hypothetical protein